jgi:CheY-like chemotaxis protein
MSNAPVGTSGPTAVRRVLIVDDNPDDRQLLATLLEREGFKVRACSSALEGLTALREQADEVCLVVLDILMEGIDGFEFRRQQLEEPAISDIPAVVITVSGLTPRDHYVLQAADYLRKPVAPDQLIGVVARHCVDQPRRVT